MALIFNFSSSDTVMENVEKMIQNEEKGEKKKAIENEEKGGNVDNV